MSTSQQHAPNKPVATQARVTGSVLQRTCACGNHTGGSGECESCKKKTEGQLQRRTSSNASPWRGSTAAPEIVHDVLHSTGRPLDRDTRSFMESRFGHDFSGVRVHTDDRAAVSASAVDADAYTVGGQIVFGRGLYSPHTATGRRLLAHELTHVVQQRGAEAPASGGLQVGSATDHSEREAEQVADIVTASGTQATGVLRPTVLVDTAAVPPLRRRNIFDAIAGLFKGDTFSEADLLAYLTKLDATGKIEDYNESDNKARAIVQAWRLGGSPYVLTAQRKTLLIEEMQSGFTGNDDERNILEILERSYNYELTMIFAAISVDDLNSDFQGPEWTRLQDFYERRFEGGMAAMLTGQVTPKGFPVPLGVDLATASTTRQQLAGAVNKWDVPCVLSILCSMDKAIVDQLRTTTVQVSEDIVYEDMEYDGSQWTPAPFPATGFSNSAKKLIGIRATDGCVTAVSTIVHEVRHQNQPKEWDRSMQETDAYTRTEQWSIDRGFRGNMDLRTEDPKTGKPIPFKQGIEEQVGTYPGAQNQVGDSVIGKTDSGDTILKRPDGTTYTRPPQKGDKVSGRRVVKKEKTLDPRGWKCPDTKQA